MCLTHICMLIYYHVSKLNLEIAQETVIWPNMTMTFDWLPFNLATVKNNFETCMILYDIALSTLFSSPFESVWVDLLSKLTLDLIDDLDLDKRGNFRWIYVCALVRFNLYYSIRQHKCHFEKIWHNGTAAVFHFTGMVLPNLQPAICKIIILG